MSCDHRAQSIKLFCLSEGCRQFPLLCEVCLSEHEQHVTISISKFDTSLQRHIKRLHSLKNEGQQEVKQEQPQSEQLSHNAQMRTDLECAAQHIYKLKQKLTKLSNFLVSMYEMMTKVEAVGEEQEVVSSLLRNIYIFTNKQQELIDTSQDLATLNKNFSNMFLLTQAVRMPDSDTGKMELSLTPSQICLIRTQSVLDRMYEFSMQLKDAILKQEDTFTSFIGRAGSVLEENKIFISRSFKPTELPITTKDEEDGDILTLMSSTHEDILVRELTGIVRCDQPEPFHGSRKQMIKLCNYWIFYNSPVCEGIYAEPQPQELPTVKGKKVNPPIRCAFCRLVKSKEFLLNYFRYDPAKRCGALCWFKDECYNMLKQIIIEKREICVHEMCLIWSNRIMMNIESSDIEFNTIIMAVQYAKSQKCRFCGCLGASLKCNRPECHVHFHFHCLKQVRLMGMQLDFDAKFRFYCEDHVIRTTQFQSDWFITRIRMMHIIQAENKLLPPIMNRQDFTADSNTHYDMEESSFILPIKKRQQ